jgi:hypothetical protein
VPRDIEVAEEVVEKVVANTEVVMKGLLRLIILEKREPDIHVLVRDHIPRVSIIIIDVKNTTIYVNIQYTI